HHHFFGATPSEGFRRPGAAACVLRYDRWQRFCPITAAGLREQFRPVVRSTHMSDTFDRSQLDGKDREQLSEIASALGVKAISRMRKADLVEAIVSATSGANGSSAASSSPRPRKIRSTVSGGDDLASLAAEEDALATGSEPVDEMTLIRPRRSSGNGSVEARDASTASTDTASTDTASTDTMATDTTAREDHSADGGGGSSAYDQQ